MKTSVLVLLVSWAFQIHAQEQSNELDVEHYALHIELSNDHDTVFGVLEATVNFSSDKNTFHLDLANTAQGKGMNVSQIKTKSGKKVRFSHSDNQLHITRTNTNATETYRIHYAGVPQTGLIIGKNKFNERTFFGDNWPNRAHHWFPCVDHPADKATMQFTVDAPKNYQCIATGLKRDTQTLENGKTRHSFASQLPLPTKVMVIGLAEFETQTLTHKHNFPIDIWAYKKDAENGFTDMQVATNVVDYFVATIGTYPFEKLSNVQSTTQFGGMENAGNIFYDENAINGRREMEALIAHEIAHQWFGNSASESDWKHLWLSEGFATYFTDLYFEHQYGTAAMNQRLEQERNKVLQFSKQYPHPVVDTSYTSLMQLLNPHSYQKGAWVLHMLRTKIGDSAFFNGIRTYYNTYKYSNASSIDFQKCMEESAQIDLNTFFNQWLHQPHQPILQVEQHTTTEHHTLVFEQLQESSVFTFELEIQLNYTDNTSEIKLFLISNQRQELDVNSTKEIESIQCDPNTKLLAQFLIL
ncbi:M1 family metallopeptidase [Crocinitomicaceae bacterium]|nr:M1 family metallopeptidase [Crocinitomicaceae bacterium]